MLFKGTLGWTADRETMRRRGTRWSISFIPWKTQISIIHVYIALERILKNLSSVFHSTLLRDSVTRFFALGFFMNQFPPSPEYVIFKNSRRYSQVKVDHCYLRHGANDTGAKDTGGKIAAGFNDTGSKFPIGINGTGGKFCHQFC